MIIKWIDKKSVLKGNQKTFKAGDIIPAKVLTESRIKYLLSTGKIEKVEKEKQPEIIEDEIKVEKPKKKKSKTEKNGFNFSDIENPVIEEDQEW